MMNKQTIKGDNNVQINELVQIISIDNVPDIALFYPDDIDRIIKSLFEYFSVLTVDSGIKVPYKNSDDLDYTLKIVKNRINKLSDDYFRAMIDNHLSYFEKIDSFLRNPINKEKLEMYENIVFLINQRIVMIRPQFVTFDEVLNKVMTEMFSERGVNMNGMNKVLILFINFMYWNCDIGKRHD